MANRFWVGGTGTWDGTTTHWSTASGGSAGASSPGTSDDAIFDSGSGTGTVTLSTNRSCRSLNHSKTTLTLTLNGTLSVGDASGGAVTIAASVTVNGTAGINLTASTTNSGNGWLITTNGSSLPKLATGNAGGKWVLADALTVATDAASALLLSSGSFVSNGKTITATQITVSGSGTHDLSGSTVNLTSTSAATVWNRTGSTLTAPATIAITTASTNTRTFAGNGNTYNALSYTVAGSTGQLTITGANTFSTLSFSDVTNARTLVLPASTTTTVTTFNVNGTASKLMSVNSSSSGTAATISKASGTVQCDYLSLKDSTATGGATFYAGDHSTNVSGNTGWNFFALVTGTGAAPLGGLTGTATGARTVTGTGAAALGGLTASGTGTPTVNGIANSALGALTASATGLPTVLGTASAPLGPLTATANGTPTDIATGSAPLGGLTATATGIVTPAVTERQGGNRRHLGNFPGRKQQTGTGELSYTLTIYGYGVVESGSSLALPTRSSSGEIQTVEVRSLPNLTHAGAVTARGRLDLNTSRRFTGEASEDEDDELFALLSIGA